MGNCVVEAFWAGKVVSGQVTRSLYFLPILGQSVHVMPLPVFRRPPAIQPHNIYHDIEGFLSTVTLLSPNRRLDKWC